ncbi:MAG: MlaA family lipoprotein [Gammaproteobacteria bacterium]
MKKINNNKLLSGVVAAILIGLNGCATTATDPRDPMEGWNRKVQSFNDGLDDYVMTPVGKGYRWVMPSFADKGVTNFFRNLDDIGVTINDFLQFKFKQGGMDVSRFLVNTTVGVAGFVDVATMIDLPKHNEDFDQTLGVWGLPTGPYLVLPFFGPSSPRGAVGLVGDIASNPLTYIGIPAASFGAGVLNAVDVRADNLSTEKIAEEAALDRYEFFRDAYLQRREYLVYDGNVPDEYEVSMELDEEFDEDELAPVNPY